MEVNGVAIDDYLNVDQIENQHFAYSVLHAWEKG